MRRRGITLVELLVALSVTGLTVATGYASLGTLADQRDRVRSASAATVRAAAVRGEIASWIEGAYVTGEAASPPFQVTDHAERGHPDDELAFLTSADTPLGRGDVAVRLYVDADVHTPERGLVAELTERFGARTARVELDSSVVALDVRCLSDMRGPRQWLRSWSSGELLPLGVEIRLGSGGTGRLAPLLRVPITVALVGGR